ncbi:WD40 repeat-like protein [Gymnopus androsaceus JB14]|uniref:WD40 repeat-like protein n=1 Tax=Gymnopus androsaceus JB14 TaxID=1447944 RepID=A0A6A4IDI9_9AGAR|nr:WD40 repeat-like protein [Gymnopus androsaceus JB14]
MSFQEVLAHGEGQTCLAFAVDGIRAFTGGGDTVVRIWKVAEGAEQEPERIMDAEHAITSIVASDDCWISSSEDSLVRRYVKDKSEHHGDITEGAGVPIRCISLDPQGKRLAVTSDNPIAKVIDMEDTLKVMLLHGHKHNVRKASWHPKSLTLTTCASDGKIIVWDVSGEEPSIIHTLDGIIPSVVDPNLPEFSHDCSVIWHPSGEQFYVISKTHAQLLVQTVICISNKDWTQLGKFTDKEVTETITALAVSPNGLYLATASKSFVYIWSTDKRQLMLISLSVDIENTGSVTNQIAFSPTEHLIAWTDSSGNFVRWREPIPLHLPSSLKRPSAATTSKSAPAAAGLFAQEAELSLDDLAAIDDDDDLVAGDEGEPNFDVEDRDFVIDDVGGYMEDKPTKFRDKDDTLVREMVSITKAQPAFQPGSTPFQGNKRYLAYNMLGVIEATQSDQEEYNLVSVDFFDKSARKSYHFNDTHKCHLAYLGERGALFASDSLVLYKPYGSWTTSQNDWTYSLKKKSTKVLGIAAGGMTPSRSFKNNSDSDFMGFGNVVVATSEGQLIFLSGTGRERRLLALGGDFVTMVAGDEWVVVVYRAGATTIDGSQSLCYKMYNFEDLSVRQRDELPIPKGHTLKWIGITQEGAPVIYDSSGMVHLVAKHRVPHHATWVCVLDTNLLERRAGKDESYWPVGITGSTFMCLILKGRQEHPGFPRPLVMELPLRMPFNTANEKEEQIERELLFKEMAMETLDDDELTTDDIISKEKAIDKEFILLIQAACKEDNIHRAIELAKLLHNIQTFDMVAKIADFYHLVGFKEKVQVLKQIREDSEDRFEAAREKRRRWNKIDARPQRLPDVDMNGATTLQPKAFQDFGPPPAIFRSGLSRATPSIENTKYAANAPKISSEDTESDPLAPSTNFSMEKRKRNDFEDVEMESQSDISISMPPPKQKANPFARKPAVDTNKNPFARKAGNKTVLKSESFFDKVDAAETTPAKPTKLKSKEKEKSEKKEGPRQQTLFGFGEKRNTGKKKATALTPPPIDEPESQVSDVTMADASQIETQPDDWEETQLVEDGL